MCVYHGVKLLFTFSSQYPQCQRCSTTYETKQWLPVYVLVASPYLPGYPIKC